MTHREVNELRKLGEKVIDIAKQRPERVRDAIATLEHVSAILSNPIISVPVFPTPNRKGMGMIDAILGKNSIGSTNSDEYSATDALSDLSAETLRVASRLGTFEWKSSQAWQAIKAHFNATLSLVDLKKLGILLAEDARLVPDRDAKRRKSVMVKWMEENWQKLSPFLQLYSWDGKAFKKAVL